MLFKYALTHPLIQVYITRKYWFMKYTVTTSNNKFPRQSSTLDISNTICWLKYGTGTKSTCCNYLKILSRIIIFFFKVKHTWDRSQESKLLEARIQVKLVAENEKKKANLKFGTKDFCWLSNSNPTIFYSMNL
jgi:hypothetical protein